MTGSVQVGSAPGYSVLAVALLRARRLIAALAFGLFALVVVIGLLRPREFTSSSSFVAETRRVPGGLSGLAAQFGLVMPGTEGAQSPQFYADLLVSPEVLRQAVSQPLRVARGSDSISLTLVEALDVHEATEALRQEEAAKQLARRMDVATSPKTGVVRLKVTARDPELARAVNGKLLDLVNRFNLTRRQSQAAAERAFTARRLDEVRNDLRVAEGRLESFLQRNRSFQNAPELRFQHDRLNREVALQQQLYTTLAQAFEQARIEEVRDTPVISVVEDASLPARPDRRGLLRRGILALVLGAMLGTFLTFGRVAAGAAGAQDQEHEGDLQQEWAAARAELLRPWRLLGRMSPTPPRA